MPFDLRKIAPAELFSDKRKSALLLKLCFKSFKACFAGTYLFFGTAFFQAFLNSSMSFTCLVL